MPTSIIPDHITNVNVDVTEIKPFIQLKNHIEQSIALYKQYCKQLGMFKPEEVETLSLGVLHQAVSREIQHRLVNSVETNINLLSKEFENGKSIEAAKDNTPRDKASRSSKETKSSK